jgi:hypothetical protein
MATKLLPWHCGIVSPVFRGYEPCVSLPLVRKAIAATTNRNELVGPGAGDLASEAVYGDAEALVGLGAGDVPAGLRERGVRNDAAGVLEEQAEDLELLIGQVDWLAGHKGAVGFEVDDDIARAIAGSWFEGLRLESTLRSRHRTASERSGSQIMPLGLRRCVVEATAGLRGCFVLFPCPLSLLRRGGDDRANQAAVKDQPPTAYSPSWKR